MKPKTVLSGILLLFVGLSLLLVIAQEKQNKPPDTGGLSEVQFPERAASDKLSHQVLVYYFHGTKRCPTCTKMEQYTRTTLTTYFAEELAAKSLLLQLVNVDEPENEHYNDEYQLFTKSVVVVDLKEGVRTRWKNLEKIWELHPDEELFIEYIRAEIEDYLGAG